MRFAVTFGQKYRHHPHPTFLYAHPDGYVVVDVPDADDGQPREGMARLAAFELLGSQWSMLYDMTASNCGEWEPDLYPRGQIGLIEQQHGHWVFVEPHTCYHDGDPQGRCWCRIRADHDVNEPEPEVP